MKGSSSIIKQNPHKGRYLSLVVPSSYLSPWIPFVTGDGKKDKKDDESDVKMDAAETKAEASK